MSDEEGRAGTTFHEWRSVHDLHKSPHNARHSEHSDTHIQALEDEITERGFNEILKITPDGGVLNGWARVLAARRIDSNYKVPCYLVQETNPMELVSISSQAGNLQESLSYEDNRKNALLMYQSGYNRNKVAKKLGVSWHNVDRWVIEEEFAPISSKAYSEMRRDPESDSGWTRERWRSFKQTLEQIVDENPHISRQEQLITAWKSVPIWGPPGTKLPWPDDETHEEPTDDSLAEPEIVEPEDSIGEASQAGIEDFEHEHAIDDLPDPSPRKSGVLVKLSWDHKDLLERYAKAKGNNLRQVTALAIYYYIDKVAKPFLGEDN